MVTDIDIGVSDITSLTSLEAFPGVLVTSILEYDCLVLDLVFGWFTVHGLCHK